jgi:hypothetical protein
MYKDEVSVINIQANQLFNITGQITPLCLNMESLASADPVDKESLKAYIASIDILMASVTSQQVLLQQALDKLAEELNK